MTNVPTIHRSFDRLEEAITALQKQITSLRVSIDGTSSGSSVPFNRSQKERPTALLADISWRQDRIGNMLADLQSSLAGVQNIVTPPELLTLPQKSKNTETEMEASIKRELLGTELV